MGRMGTLSATVSTTRPGGRALAAILIGCALLAACGGGGGSKSTASTSAAPTSAVGASPTSAAESATTEASAASATSEASAAGGTATITSVTFSGTTASPTVTVRGSNLGQLPAPNPAYTPEGHPPLCPAPPSGNQGYDYGTSYYLADTSRNWSGGRYRPELNELDCIGLVTSSFSATEVMFTFGSAYAQYQQKYDYLLAEGDTYQLAINGATYQGTVHYTG